MENNLSCLMVKAMTVAKYFHLSMFISSPWPSGYEYRMHI